MGTAGPTQKMTKVSGKTEHQTLKFMEAGQPWEHELYANPDPTSTLNGFDDAGLQDFLSRPLKIQTYTWTPGSPLYQTTNPWSDFFGNTNVKDKLRRYRNLRCNLHVRIILHGNGFYYGRALVSYNPYLLGDQVTKDRASFQQDLIAQSNKPCLLLDPCSSEGGTLKLPFIWPENYLDITNSGWANQMGKLVFHDFDQLKHANGGTDPITVSVFAWAEDVSLLIPTAATVQAGPIDVKLDKYGYPETYEKQAGRRSKKYDNTRNRDEFVKDGLISKPASAVAEVADALSGVPFIAPFAKATSLVAQGVGAVARLFGFSRPQIVTDIQTYVPRYAGNLVNTDRPEAVTKLTVDSKNELTIDTRTMGLSGVDELNIKTIACRPTFWRQFDWLESNNADDLLASMSVNPFCVDTLAASVGTEIHSTALAFAANPFEYWQGTIKFHFKIVCSNFHKGALRIVYNPKTNPVTMPDYNTVYSTVIDIEHTREFEFDCKWTDIRAWNSCMGIGPASIANLFSTSSPVVGGTDFDNGTLSVYVLNELATPSTTLADIKVQVWVNAGDDIAFAAPSRRAGEMAIFEPQSTPTSSSGVDNVVDGNDNSNNPLGGEMAETYGSPSSSMENHDNQYLIYQGERITSFRDLLRRYQYHTSYFPQSQGTGFRYYALTIAGMPYWRGWDPNGLDNATNSAAGTSPYNFCANTLLNYLAPAFVCQRGSIRHKWIKSGTRQSTDDALLCVSRQLTSGNIGLFETSYDIDLPLAGAKRGNFLEMQRSTLTGTVVTPTRLNPVAEIEIPFYSKGQRFRAARRVDMINDGDTQAVEVAVETDATNGDAEVRLDHYVSIGEDFTLGMFVGAPVMYLYIDPVAV